MTEGFPHPIAEGATPDLVVITMGGPDSAWHYRLAVHGDMAMPPEPIALPANDALVSLGAFHRYDGVSVEVSGAIVAREIDAADWLEGAPIIANLSKLSSHRFASPSGEQGDLLFLGGETVSRIFAARFGHRLFVIKCTAPAVLYPQVADTFAGVIASFEPVEASGRFCEAVSRHGASGPVVWRCLVPDTWRVDPGGTSEQASSFQATNLRNRVDDDGEVVGRLAVAVFARSAIEKPREAANEYLDALAEAGLRVISDEFVPEPASEPFDRSWILVSAVTRPDSLPGEVRCRVLRHPAAWALAAVLSPTADDDRPAYLENKRALDVATSTLKIEGGNS